MGAAGRGGDDDCPEERHYVEEADEVQQLIGRVVQSQGADAAAVYNRFKAIMYKYQEQSQLLDPHLEGMVAPLAGLLRQHTGSAAGGQQGGGGGGDDDSLKRVMGACRLLHVLVIVRGYKTVAKFFPHEASDLERATAVLQAVKARSAAAAAGSDETLASWEAQTILLVWLSILILIPFELATVDSAAPAAAGTTTAVAAATSSSSSSGGGAAAGAGAAGQQRYTPLVATLLQLCKDYLHHPGGVRDMAALLLGRLLTRPDMPGALDDFLSWCTPALSAVDPLHAPFLVPGVLQALAFILKFGQRTRLLPSAPRAWALLTAQWAGNASLSGNMLARKLAIKVCQRVGLTFLEPRLAPWRYEKHDASLSATLGSSAAAAAAAAAGAGAAPAQPVAAAGDAGPGDNGDDEEIEIVEEIEEVLEVLLGALRDKDTVVRWSAAKGVGRIVGCLPKALGDEVVASVLELFKPTEGDAAWHGGCLALAELARRGLLLPDRLPVIVPICQKALHYDVRRGPHSIGAHVRDAAAYVCWAFARAYAPHVLQDFVRVLSTSLLTIACYDREVNCRRAAAAAFQECVGRLGNFPHGIDILAVADYFSVGNVHGAYSRVAPQVAAFAEYRLPLAEHLLHAKLQHWEKPLRELAARGAAALVPHLPQLFAADALDALLPRCLDATLEVRHGALVGVAELLPALAAAGAVVSPDRLEQVAGLVPAIDKARLYRGKGGEIMREAVGRLVESASKVRLLMSGPQHAKVVAALDENLRHPHEPIQQAAVRALHSYARAYTQQQQQQGAEGVSGGGSGGGGGVDAEGVARLAPVVQQYAGGLHDANVAVRRGYALALGALPAALLSPAAGDVIDALTGATVIEDCPDERDVESRTNAVYALGNVLRTLYHCDDAVPLPGQRPAASLIAECAVPCLLRVMTDYSTDPRGDVGSWAREAAMSVLVTCLQLLAERAAAADSAAGEARALLAQLAGGVVAALLKQGVERIAKVRACAIKHLTALVDDARIAPHVPGCASVAAALPREEDDIAGIVSLEAVPRLAGLLAQPSYTEQLLEGLAASIGGVDNSLSKVAAAAVTDTLSGAAAAGGGGDTLLARVGRHLLSIWGRHAKSPRMATPLLRTADMLLCHTDLPAACSGSGGSGGGEEEDEAEAGRPVVDGLVELVRAETRGCTDVARLMDAATCLCHLVLPDRPACRTSALQGLLVLLGSKYPRVRRHSAEQLYLQLLAFDADAAGMAPEAVEAANELLLGTSWDDSVEDAKAARDGVAAALGVEVPKMKAAAGAGGGGGRAKPVRDENASYQALLDDFARGYGF